MQDKTTEVTEFFGKEVREAFDHRDDLELAALYLARAQAIRETYVLMSGAERSVSADRYMEDEISRANAELMQLPLLGGGQ